LGWLDDVRPSMGASDCVVLPSIAKVRLEPCWKLQPWHGRSLPLMCRDAAKLLNMAEPATCAGFVILGTWLRRCTR